MDVGLSMKQLRQQLGMTQEELSELSGVSRVSIGNYERGDREPTISIAKAITEALDVTLEDLVSAKIDKLLDESNTNLLEIKLKNTDSVPEVHYKGERLDKLPCGLVDISYHWKTDGFTNEDRGANDINIEYYPSSNDKYLDKKTIGHKRDC